MRLLLWIAFVVLVIAHLAVVIGVTLSFFVLPIYSPWYVAMPLMTFIWFFSTSKIPCRFTDLENTLREKLALRAIHGFVGHYFLKLPRLLYHAVFQKTTSHPTDIIT